MKKRTASIGVRVSPETKAALATIAEAEQRTISQIVNFLIEEGLQRRAAASKPRAKK
jgi:hypothetical protein